MEKQKDKKNIREPFRPEDTPNPPQIIDPNDREKRKTPVEDKPVRRKDSDRSAEQKNTNAADKQEKPHLLGDDADISDETKI